jgi:hypothetical protein
VHEVAKRCKEALHYFDSLVMCNVSVSRSLAESMPLVPCEAIIQGRCKDFHVLQSRAKSVSNFRFICIKHLLNPVASHSVVNSALAPVTVQLSSLAALTTMDTVPSAYFSSLRIAADRAGVKDICVIFCEDKTEDDTVHAAALHGFTLV